MNAVMTQIWYAVAVCVLVAIVKRRLGIQADLYFFLEVLSLTLLEKTLLLGILSSDDPTDLRGETPNQLNIVDKFLGHYSLVMGCGS